MRSIDRWKKFLADELGEENAPKEFRTIEGRSLVVDYNSENDFKVNFTERGDFVCVSTPENEERGIKY